MFERSFSKEDLCATPDVCLAMYLARGYKSDPGVDHWTTVKIMVREIRKCFLGYGGDKEFSVKGYVDASFNTYLNDSE